MVTHTHDFALERPRQKDCSEFKISLGYVINSTPTWRQSETLSQIAKSNKTIIKQ